MTAAEFLRRTSDATRGEAAAAQCMYCGQTLSASVTGRHKMKGQSSDADREQVKVAAPVLPEPPHTEPDQRQVMPSAADNAQPVSANSLRAEAGVTHPATNTSATPSAAVPAILAPLPRYRPAHHSCAMIPDVPGTSFVNGPWVKFADVARLVTDLQQQIAALNAAVPAILAPLPRYRPAHHSCAMIPDVPGTSFVNGPWVKFADVGRLVTDLQQQIAALNAGVP